MQNGFRPILQYSLSPNLTKFQRTNSQQWPYRSLRTYGADSKVSPLAGQPESHPEKLRRLEAVLFLCPQGVTSRRAAKLAGLADATEVRTLIRELNSMYDGQLKPYRVEEVAGGFAIWTRPRYASWLRKLSYIPGEVHLGRSALETLSIVAYRQPILRSEIEAIRGVGSSEVLKQLMELDLIRISGRSEDLGRPYFYGTTPRFLQMFGLRSAERLPLIDWVNQTVPADDPSSSSSDFATESDVKESTVRITNKNKAVLGEHWKGDQVMDETASLVPILAIDDEDDDEFFDDEEDDEDDEDDDIEDWEEEEVEDVDDIDDVDDEEEEEDSEEEAVEELDEDEEEEWEEVDDEEESVEEDEEDDEDDDWDDDDDDDDWDDDDDDEDWE